MLNRGDWFRLKRGNDWGSNYFARAPLSAQGYAACSRAYRLAAGDTVRVRLLDGSEREGLVALTKVRETVGDMGHDYDVHSEVPRVAFADGTYAELQGIELQYDPERDPTAAELSESSKG